MGIYLGRKEVGVGVMPTGTIEITENGEYDVRDKAVAVVNIEVGSGEESKTIEISLPEVFANCVEIFHFTIRDKILISGRQSSSPRTALLLYNISDNTQQILYNGGSFQYFQMIDLYRCFVVDNNFTNKGVFVYNSLDDSFVNVFGGSRYREFKKFFKITDNEWLLGGDAWADGVLLYNSNTNECTKIYDTGTYWNVFIQINNRVLITSGNGEGILIYNILSKSIEQLSDTVTNYQQLYIFKNNDVLLRPRTSNVTGFLLYKYSTNTIEFFESEAYYLEFVLEVADNKFIISGRSTTEIILLNLNDYTTKILSSTQGYWDISHKLQDGMVVINSKSQSYGVWLYNPDNDEISTPVGTSNNYDVFIDLPNGDCLIGSSTTTSNGIILYKSSTKNIEMGITAQKITNHLFLPNDIVFMISNSKFVLYDMINQNFSSISTRTSLNKYLILDNNKILFIGNSSSNNNSYNGVALYDITTNSNTNLMNANVKLNSFEEKGDDILIYNTDKTICNLTYSYNKTSDTFIIFSVSVEV